MLSASNSEATRQAVRAQERTYNAALAEVCATYPRCRWDGGAASGVAFRPSDVSIVDHFRPSVGGQVRFASVSWAARYLPVR